MQEIGNSSPMDRITNIAGTTERGFAIYVEFVDTYGSNVRVQESSAASEPKVWIFCDRSRGYASDDLGGDRQAATPHLSVEQARCVRDALDEFIKGNS
jgi:hypothetical protein